ncbi:MAG: hypothetical protein Q7U04_04760 [Bacteriovorax sp.]|nr:hypothetical protein [Bacteriovorax sp.]
MNKKLFLIFHLAFSSFAAYSSETVIVLESINKHGKIIKNEVVISKNSDLYVNSEKLTSIEVITKAEFLQQISTFPSSKAVSQCSSGWFRHIFKKDDLVNIEKGCLNSARFIDLKNSFKNLKKDIITTK